jgi:hypothetical protein
MLNRIDKLYKDIMCGVGLCTHKDTHRVLINVIECKNCGKQVIIKK